MLNITLASPKKEVGKTYRELITHLMSHTQAFYGASPLGNAKHQEPSFDVGQVCCWMCEKPLGNGMRMCHVRKNDIELIPEPTNENDEDGMNFDFGERPLDAGIQDIQLICGDCSEGIDFSLRDPEKLKQLILDSSEESVANPKLYQHYIWPNRIYHILNDSVKVLSRENKEFHDVSQGTIYYPDQCFIYTEKVAWIKYMGNKETGQEETVEEKFESRVFVEPNPNIPKPLQIMAQNTIRLFRLNGIHYHHGLEHHEIHYHLSASDTQYDDLRLTGRGKAFDRANTALNQFKTAREFDQGLYNVLLDQQKIIMELNGYRSVWATVFNDGNDPGGLAGLFGIPTPVPPTAESQVIDSEMQEITKKELADFRNKDGTAETLYKEQEIAIRKLIRKNKLLEKRIVKYHKSKQAILREIKNIDLTQFLKDEEKIKNRRKLKADVKKSVLATVFATHEESSVDHLRLLAEIGNTIEIVH